MKKRLILQAEIADEQPIPLGIIPQTLLLPYRFCYYHLFPAQLFTGTMSSVSHILI